MDSGLFPLLNPLWVAAWLGLSWTGQAAPISYEFVGILASKEQCTSPFLPLPLVKWGVCHYCCISCCLTEMSTNHRHHCNVHIMLIRVSVSVCNLHLHFYSLGKVEGQKHKCSFSVLQNDWGKQPSCGVRCIKSPILLHWGQGTLWGCLAP